MRKKLSNTKLLIAFVVLLVLVVVLFTNKSTKKESSFQKQLVEFTTDDVSEMQLYPKSLKGEVITAKNEDGNWMLYDADNKSYKADKSTINSLLKTLNGLEAKALVGNSKDKWEKYEVTDSLASRVKLFNDKKLLADVYLGKFQYKQPRNMSTYVRLAKKKETYKVDGYLSAQFNRKINDLRDKSLFDIKGSQVKSLAFTYPADSSFVVSKENNKWLIDGAVADSSAVAHYVASLSLQHGSEIWEGKIPNDNLYKLDIEKEDDSKTELWVKKQGDKLLLNSSENSDVWFDDNSKIKRYFVSPNKFRIK